MNPEDEGGGPIYDPDDGKPLAVIIQNPKRVYKESRNKWKRERRALSSAERRWCVEFFRTIKKSPARAGDGRTVFPESNDENKESVANMLDKVNEVKIVGVVMKIKPEADRFFALIDCGQEKWVPVTAHEKDPRQRAGLLSDLLRYQTGDEMVLKGYVRAWSQKEGEGWKNGIDIRIIDLKPGTVPTRQPQQPQPQQAQRRDTAAPPNGW